MFLTSKASMKNKCYDFMCLISKGKMVNLLHGTQIHIHFLVVTKRDFLLLVPPGFRVARDVVLGVELLHWQVVREPSV